jgi:hypothetical protein
MTPEMAHEMYAVGGLQAESVRTVTMNLGGAEAFEVMFGVARKLSAEK